jgi:hypothetical protein
MEEGTVTWNTAHNSAYSGRITRWRCIFVKPLAIKAPEHLQPPPDVTPTLDSSPRNIAGTGRVPGIDNACKDGAGAF